MGDTRDPVALYQEALQKPDDLRLQFQIIQHLSESVRLQTITMAKQAEQLTEVLIRLERIEAKETAEVVARLQKRIERLERDLQQREGAKGVIALVFKTPVIAWIGAAGVAVWALLTKGVH